MKGSGVVNNQYKVFSSLDNHVFANLQASQDFVPASEEIMHGSVTWSCLTTVVRALSNGDVSVGLICSLNSIVGK